MSFFDKLKAVLGGKKKEAEPAYGAIERQVEALEGRLVINEHVKRVEGGVDAFELAYDQVQQALAGYGAETTVPPEIAFLRKRIDLARRLAHFLRETDGDKRQELGKQFIADFHEVRNQLHYRTKIKYERIRIDLGSGRLR